MCSNFRERVSMPMLDGVLSIMEKATDDLNGSVRHVSDY